MKFSQAVVGQATCLPTKHIHSQAVVGQATCLPTKHIHSQAGSLRYFFCKQDARSTNLPPRHKGTPLQWRGIRKLVAYVTTNSRKLVACATTRFRKLVAYVTTNSRKLVAYGTIKYSGR